MRDAVELAGPLGTPLGLAQWKRASSRGEAGTSGFLSVSDSDPPTSGSLQSWKRRVSLVLSEEGNSACLSRCSGGLRPLFELCVEPTGFSRRCTGVSVPLRVVPSPTGLPSKRCPCNGFFSRVDREIEVDRHVAQPPWLISISSCGRPHSEMRREGRESLPDHAGESTLLSPSGGEKGLR